MWRNRDDLGAPVHERLLRVEVERLDQAIAALDRVLTKAIADHETLDFSRHDSANNALRTATRELDRRLESMNEFREQLRDQTATFISRPEYEAKHAAILDQIALVSQAQRSQRDRTAGLSQGGRLMVTILGGALTTANAAALFYTLAHH